MDRTRSRAPIAEVWMRLRSPALMQGLMDAKGRQEGRNISHRVLAQAAWPGTSAHSYISRALRGDPKAQKFRPDAAIRIATFLGVETSVLFEAVVSTDGGNTTQQIRNHAPAPVAAAGGHARARRVA